MFNKKTKIQDTSLDDFMSYGCDLKNRIIYVEGDVDDVSVSQAMKALQLLDLEDSTKPIKLIINSFGGSVYDGLALYDAIRNAKSEVYTYGYGKIMSMAVSILIAGDKRFISKSSTVMVHEISDFVVGQLQELKRAVKEAERLESLMLDFFVERTSNKDRKYWESLKNDTYFTAEEAVKLGIADEIITVESE